MDKIEKKEELYIYLDNEFEGEISEVVKKIQNIPNRLKKEHDLVKDNPDMFHKFEIGWDYCGHDGGKEPKIIGYRWETEEELNKRVEANKKAKDNAKKKKLELEKQEKENYLKLKAKYE